MTSEEIKETNLDVNATMRCSTICAHCNRGIGALDWSDVRDLTIEDAKRIAAAVKESGYLIGKIKIVGGEPTIHPHLKEIVEILAPLTTRLWVITNGMKPKDTLPKLPPNCRYKFDYLENKDHFAFFVSPSDLGLESLIMKDLKHCGTIVHSGRSAEPEGFIQCALARPLMKAMGKEDQLPFYDKLEDAMEPDREICKHCIYSIGSKHLKTLSWRAAAGEFEVPTKSFTEHKFPKIKHAANDHYRRAMKQDEEVEVISTDNLISTINKIPAGHEARAEKQRAIAAK